MLELVLTVCSIVGADCRMEPVPLQANTNMRACMMASQIEGAKFVQQNPNYFIKRAVCRPAKTA